MALVVGELSECVICGSPLAGRPFTATSGCAFEPSHKLWRFCDAPFHCDCLDTWEHREPFSRGYFDIHRESFIQMGTLLDDHPRWILGCGPAPADQVPYYARVYFRDWPQCLNCRFEEWEDFLKDPFEEDIVGGILDIAEEIVSLLRIEVPDLDSLLKLRKQNKPIEPTR